MKKLLTVLVTLSIVFCIIGLLPVHSEAKIYDSVIRLHVKANSNSESDQRLKLAVRDAILEKYGERLGKYDTLSDAEQGLSELLCEIEDCAEDVIRNEGESYAANVSLGAEEYPTKSYGALCFPAGKYLSLQVNIGEAQGENWWCVLFPPLCLDAATRANTNEDAFISVGLSPDQYEIITETDKPSYEARFKILEAIQGIIE